MRINSKLVDTTLGYCCQMARASVAECIEGTFPWKPVFDSPCLWHFKGSSWQRIEFKCPRQLRSVFPTADSPVTRTLGCRKMLGGKTPEPGRHIGLFPHPTVAGLKPCEYAEIRLNTQVGGFNGGFSIVFYQPSILVVVAMVRSPPAIGALRHRLTTTMRLIQHVRYVIWCAPLFQTALKQLEADSLPHPLAALCDTCPVGVVILLPTCGELRAVCL